MTAAPQASFAVDAKLLANATARAALAGITLHHLEGDFGRPVFVATRWALTKQFDSLEDVERWLDRVNGGAH